MKLTTQQSGFFMSPSTAPAVSTKTSLANRVLDLETALADILGEAELSERHPELSFVATQRIAAVARRSLLGEHADDASDDDVAALSERRISR